MVFLSIFLSPPLFSFSCPLMLNHFQDPATACNILSASMGVTRQSPLTSMPDLDLLVPSSHAFMT